MQTRKTRTLFLSSFFVLKSKLNCFKHGMSSTSGIPLWKQSYKMLLFNKRERGEALREDCHSYICMICMTKYGSF